MSNRARETVMRVLAILLSVFTLVEANYPRLSPQSQLAIFAMLGDRLGFPGVADGPAVERHSVFHRSRYLGLFRHRGHLPLHRRANRALAPVFLVGRALPR